MTHQKRQKNYEVTQDLKLDEREGTQISYIYEWTPIMNVKNNKFCLKHKLSKLFYFTFNFPLA